ncbi:MAG: hypothetical protein GTO02_13670, partial [Candidatus Dadabacteria bacterium]|nr:hypothetical protein [Candidatus Dadabacteria bacterium]
MIKIPKNIVMIIGHEHPKFLIDTAESIRYFNNNNNYEIVFAIDFNKQTSAYLQEKYGRDRVFVSREKNGWGRG